MTVALVHASHTPMGFENQYSAAAARQLPSDRFCPSCCPLLTSVAAIITLKQTTTTDCTNALLHRATNELHVRPAVFRRPERLAGRVPSLVFNFRFQIYGSVMLVFLRTQNWFTRTPFFWDVKAFSEKQHIRLVTWIFRQLHIHKRRSVQSHKLYPFWSTFNHFLFKLFIL